MLWCKCLFSFVIGNFNRGNAGSRLTGMKFISLSNVRGIIGIAASLREDYQIIVISWI